MYVLYVKLREEVVNDFLRKFFFECWRFWYGNILYVLSIQIDFY